MKQTEVQAVSWMRQSALRLGVQTIAKPLMLLESRRPRPSFLQVDARQCCGNAWRLQSTHFAVYSVSGLPLHQSLQPVLPTQANENEMHGICHAMLCLMSYSSTWPRHREEDRQQLAAERAAHLRSSLAPVEVRSSMCLSPPTQPRGRICGPSLRLPGGCCLRAPKALAVARRPPAPNHCSPNCSEPLLPCRHGLGSHPPHGPR